MIRRLAIVLALIIAVPVVAIPGWIATHRTDLDTVDDADLTVPRSQVPPGQNGFDHFVKAAETLDLPAEADERSCAIRATELWEPEWTEAMLRRNESALASVRRGVDAPAFQVPLAPPDETADVMEPLIGVRRLLSLSGAEARLRLAQGDYAGAMERAALGLRAGKRLSGGEGVGLLGMMFAAAFQSISFDYIDHVVREVSPSRDSARAWVAMLESARWSPADWERTWASEYQGVRALTGNLDIDASSVLDSEDISWMTALTWRVIPADYLWQPNRTLSWTAEIYRDRQRRSAFNCRAAYEYLASYHGRGPALWKVRLSPNPVGGMLLGLALPDLHRFDLKRCHAETKISLVQALIAAKAYWHAEGRLPARLGDLVPEYLDRFPHDRFAGAPLRYSRERQVVYSVGDDFTDSGGGDEFDLGNAAEPAVSLSF